MKHFIVVFVVAFLGNALAEECGSYFAEMSCRGGTWTLNDEDVAKIKVCQEPAFYGDGGAKPVACRLYCNNAVFGVLDKNGEVTRDIYREWVEARFPEDLKELANEHFDKCFSEHGDGSRIDRAEDASCEQAGAFNKCAWEIVAKLTC